MKEEGEKSTDSSNYEITLIDGNSDNNDKTCNN